MDLPYLTEVTCLLRRGWQWNVTFSGPAPAALGRPPSYIPGGRPGYSYTPPLYLHKEHFLFQTVEWQQVSKEFQLPLPHCTHLLTPANSIALTSVILAVQGTPSILLRNNISTALIHFLSFLFSDQTSLPCNKTDHTKHFNNLSLIAMFIFRVDSTFFILLKVAFAIPILLHFCHRL